ncbi:SMI1/KNR4 family protein [Labrys sp. LIt4]|uniref:SMI1/KNR4 family protein n=1 Tax=Labrys sp. LIt4 TaxID=2821355 RepID=UPI001AE0CCCE|nr:SMI1/KNR4 family protein [Labrys sp. LIt4]MBP0583481.1 SMI1/KNR4 family protein [Labrys sp. LIt4]
MPYDIQAAIDELKDVRLKLPKEQYLPDDAVLDRYESEVGIKFSEDYRKFAKEAIDSIHNGMDALRITPDHSSPRELITALQNGRKIGLPNDWLPISEDNGNYYCITPNGKVRYWSHDGSANEEWDDIGSWIHEVWLGEE